VGKPMPPDGGDADSVLREFADAGVDVGELAAKLQSDGAASFVDAWKDLMSRMERQTAAVGA
jgi:transaldolase